MGISDFFHRRSDNNENNNGANGENYEYYEDTHDENGEYAPGRRDFRDERRFSSGDEREPSREMSRDLPRDGRDRAFMPYNVEPTREPAYKSDPMRGGGQNFMVYEPHTADDVQTLIDFLKTRESAIINLDNVEPEVSQRVLDFVSGAMYALNGSVHRVAGNIFLLSPEGVGITNSYENKK